MFRDEHADERDKCGDMQLVSNVPHVQQHFGADIDIDGGDDFFHDCG